MQKECLTTIDYTEFDELVNSTYGITEYEFVAVQECDNDSDHRFEVKEKLVLDPNHALDKYDIEQLELIKADKAPLYSNHVIFQDLVNRGILEPGIYLVEVSW